MRSLPWRTGLYFHTLRYLRPQQILWRIWLRGLAVPLDRLGGWRLRMAASRVANLRSDHLLPGLEAFQQRLSEVEKEELVSAARKITALRFSFLEETREFDQTVDWHPEGTSLLWRYHLHYFDYALTLAFAAQIAPDGERRRFFEGFRRLADDWIAGNPLGRGDGWRPYPLSVRIVNWLYAYRAFEPEMAGDAAFRQRLAESITLQSLYLQRHIEFDVGGNHLVKNAKALFLAGLSGSGATYARMAATGERILLNQLSVQVLRDGGHYERSAHYHKIVLADYLECLAAAAAAERPWPERALSYLRAMSGFLAGCLHPDQDIPLFGDAGLNPPSPGEVLAVARVLIGAPILPDGYNPVRVVSERLSPWALAVGGSTIPGHQGAVAPFASGQGEKAVAAWAFAETGWHLLEAGHWHLALDAGPPCPPDLPAHAHSDGLSVEISWGTNRLVVDPGAYLYQDQAWRRYLRSTAAHNTVAVAGDEQTETWGQFRAARRAQPLGARCWIAQGWAGFVGAVRFGTDPRLLHRRWILLWPDGCLLADAISADRPAKARVLLAPGWTATPRVEGGVSVEGAAGPFRAWASRALRILGPGEGPGPGWFSPRFGVLEPALTLEWGLDRGVAAFLLMPGQHRLADLRVRGGVKGLEIEAIVNTNEFRVQCDQDAIRMDAAIGG